MNTCTLKWFDLYPSSLQTIVYSKRRSHINTWNVFDYKILNSHWLPGKILSFKFKYYQISCLKREVYVANRIKTIFSGDTWIILPFRKELYRMI